jgi:error-prone DNA polymerase
MGCMDDFQAMRFPGLEISRQEMRQGERRKAKGERKNPVNRSSLQQITERDPHPGLPAYAELQCKTNFSFLEGGSHADELVQQAVRWGYRALAVTDRASLSGIVRAHGAAKGTGLKLIVGAHLEPTDALPIILWAPDRPSYGRLARLITVGRRRAAKGECELSLDDLAAHAEGLLAGVLPLHACEQGQKSLGIYRELFADRIYLLAPLHYGPQDAELLQIWQTLSRQTQIPLVASGDVHYHVAERQLLQEVLTATRLGTTVAELREQRFFNAERHLRSRETLAEIYRTAPELLARTCEIADRCNFSLDELRYEYPEELAPAGQASGRQASGRQASGRQAPVEFLKDLTWQGAHWRYPQGIPPKVSQLLDHELKLIEDLQYEAYFLTVWDLVHFARSRGILCQGRGSAANSAVCYCLGVTSVDPETTDLLFERFISRERNEAPDIDVDFEHERREEVLQYIYAKYGRDRAGMTAEVITYRLRSAIRDAGKALGLTLDRVDRLSKLVEGHSWDDLLPQRMLHVGLDPQSLGGRQFLEVVSSLVGFPRHLSQHVGGMVITRGPLCELTPLENAAMEGRTVLSWDKNDLDELGILKVDCLALGMLTAIRKAFAFLEEQTGDPWHLAKIPPGDVATYDMICEADTVGVFQIESRAQMSMLPRLKPRCYYDLVIEVAIVRPGPIQGQMVHPYLRRRAGLEPVVYATPAIQQVLEKTMGVPIFQEQAMRLAVVAAGFTPGEADQLRRAMGAWRKTGVIEQFRQKMMEGMQARGLSEEFAAQVFQQIRGFGEYGFPESHAASFALLVYVSAWLKCHHPAIFCAAMLNSQPLGFYSPAQLIGDARKHHVVILPIDINASDWDCTLEQWGSDRDPQGPSQLAVRLGMRLIVGLSKRHVNGILQERLQGKFRDLHDLSRRTRLGQAVLTLLADADAFPSFQRDRRQNLWDALAEERIATPPLPLLGSLADDPAPPPALPPMDPLQQILRDYTTTGLSLRGHPLEFYRNQLRSKGVASAHDLGPACDGRSMIVGGIVLLRQRPSTAKGITFVTLEDETGTVNLVVHQKTWDKYQLVARQSPAWIAFGRVEAREKVIHVVARQLVDMGRFLRQSSEQNNPLADPSLGHRSRNWC